MVQTSDGGYALAGLSSSWVNGGCYWLTKITDLHLDVDISITNNTPQNYTLGNNYPNPFNPSTTIKFDLPRSSRVKIEIINILGQSIKNLISEELSAGQHQINWGGRDNSGLDVSSGVYFYRINGENFSETKKMILMK